VIRKIVFLGLAAALVTGCAVNENKNDNSANVNGVTGGDGNAVKSVGGAATSLAAPPASSSAPVANRVRWHGSIGLTVTGSLLDSAPPTEAPVVQTGDVAWYHLYNAIDGYTSTDNLSPWTGSGAPTGSACSDVISTHPQGEIDNVHQGTAFCVRTAQGRYAYARVLSTTDDAAELDVTVWELP